MEWGRWMILKSGPTYLTDSRSFDWFHRGYLYTTPDIRVHYKHVEHGGKVVERIQTNKE